MKIQPDEEVLPQYVWYIGGNQYLIFPLKEAIFITRGLIVKMKPDNQLEVSSTPEPEVKLLRSGISFKWMDDKVTDVLTLGGNEDKSIYKLSLQDHTWTQLGALPQYHTVTE